MKKLIRVRDVILSVNREYIRSAAQSDDYRTEPAFKLQGSYRNMNRIAEKVFAVMNDKELETLIVSNYENDVQTLTSDAEANLLKFKELMGILSEAEQSCAGMRSKSHSGKISSSKVSAEKIAWLRRFCNWRMWVKDCRISAKR